VSAVVVPAYVAETAPAKHRGALVSLYEALLCVGMLCASLVNFALHDVPGASFARVHVCESTLVKVLAPVIVRCWGAFSRCIARCRRVAVDGSDARGTSTGAYACGIAVARVATLASHTPPRGRGSGDSARSAHRRASGAFRLPIETRLVGWAEGLVFL